MRLTIIAGENIYNINLQVDIGLLWKQEGLAVASIAWDNPSSLPGMHRDHNALPSQTDGQMDTDNVA